MILEQYYLRCLAQASYLVADEQAGVAAIVDPRRDVDLYLAEAERLGVEIRHVFLTHFHADFLAGHLELRERTGATIHLGAQAEAEYDFEPVAEGDELALGARVQLRFLETPGHTPEGISILVYDLESSDDEPYAVLTGDTLFVGAVGRPDLMSSVGRSADELARELYHSLREKLMRLPDATLVYPGHGPGSACGKGMSSETFSTIGEQRELNYALQPMSEDAFVREMTTALPEAPAYFAHDAQLNKAERQTLDTMLRASLAPLAPDDLLRLANSGAQVLDTRTADAFAAGHLKGSTNVGLDGNFASWVGTLLAPDRGIVLVGEPGSEEEAALRLGRIGFDRVAGYLEGGVAAFQGHPELVLESWPRVEPGALRAELAADDPPLVVDVRTPGEWEEGHIEGALHVPLARLADELDAIPNDRELVLVCKGGYRSSSAASLLAASGPWTLRDLRGGMDAWTGASTSCAP